MVKKLRQKAAQSAANNGVTETLKASAQQIWLAGMGALTKTQKESQKLLDALVEQSDALQKRAAQATGDSIHEATSRATGVANQVQKQAVDALDKLEAAFEQRIERTLKRMGVPSSKEVAVLTEKVQTLTEAVRALSSQRTTLKKATLKNTKAKKSATTKAVKKVATKTPTRSTKKAKG